MQQLFSKIFLLSAARPQPAKGRCPHPFRAAGRPNPACIRLKIIRPANRRPHNRPPLAKDAARHLAFSAALRYNKYYMARGGRAVGQGRNLLL